MVDCAASRQRLHGTHVVEVELNHRNGESTALERNLLAGQHLTERLAKVLRQKRVEKRINATVHVGETVGDDLQQDESMRPRDIREVNENE